MRQIADAPSAARYLPAVGALAITPFFEWLIIQ
jgi:hypothetical protein